MGKLKISLQAPFLSAHVLEVRSVIIAQDLCNVYSLEDCLVLWKPWIANHWQTLKINDPRNVLLQQ